MTQKLSANIDRRQFRNLIYGIVKKQRSQGSYSDAKKCLVIARYARPARKQVA